MNIDQWIEGLEHANPPSESPLSVDQPHALRKRGRGSRKSSLLEPFPNGERRDINDELPIISVGSSSSGTSNATSISTSSFSSSSSSSLFNNKYQKRPRHHTKADKYHLRSKSKAKPEKRKRKKKEKEKEKRPKHNSRKKHKSKPVTGLVQTFQAKNVPKERLTLDPGTKFGLYTKGRSSVPTRGKGLPDLVFSEMKFLQKPECSTKEESEPKSKKKPRKKKRRQTSEKEISRYFDVGGTRHGDDEMGQKRHTPPPDTSAVPQDLQSASPVISDLLEKPFLGFGSRGTHPPTTSYYSWSESGRESSVRVKQFAPDLETLAAGQLQSSRPQEQKKSILQEHDPGRYPSVERAITKPRRKTQYLAPESAQESKQATSLPNKPPLIQEADTEAMPMSISNEHETFVPAAASLANQDEARTNSTKKNLVVHEAVPNPPNVGEEHHGVEPAQSRSTSNPVLKEYPEPWEELLQNCALAARPLMPMYCDEGLAQYDATATQGQLTPATYGHADLRLWRTDVYEPLEHDYLDNASFMNEHVPRAQPEAIEHQEDNFPFFEETLDENLESLDSEDDYEVPINDGLGWREGDGEQHGTVLDCRIRDDEAMDELAMFWQPNRLY